MESPASPARLMMTESCCGKVSALDVSRYSRKGSDSLAWAAELAKAEHVMNVGDLAHKLKEGRRQ